MLVTDDDCALNVIDRFRFNGFKLYSNEQHAITTRDKVFLIDR